MNPDRHQAGHARGAWFAEKLKSDTRKDHADIIELIKTCIQDDSWPDVQALQFVEAELGRYAVIVVRRLANEARAEMER